MIAPVAPQNPVSLRLILVNRATGLANLPVWRGINDFVRKTGLMKKSFIWLLVIGLAVTSIAAVATRGIGFSSRGTPWALEEATMRAARRWATPSDIKSQRNPVEATAESLTAGLEHWADHCAMCHSNDGSGETTIGRSLYPPAPDMRKPATQGMSDGELFYVIERGIPLTGMPAWGTGTPDGERSSWELVLFIRHLADLSESELREMEALNPKSPAEAKRKAEIDDFLSGGKIIR